MSEEKEDDIGKMDAEIAEMQKKLLEMEAEAQNLKDEDGAEEGGPSSNGAQGGDDDALLNGDEDGDGNGEDEGTGGAEDRQIFVGNLHEDVDPDALNKHFKECGTVNRITILCDKFTGKPKGYAYMEFEEPEAIDLALALNETDLLGKAIKVSKKRTNVPRYMLRGRGRGRGRGGRGRGRGRGRGGYRGRGRGRGRYTPY